MTRFMVVLVTALLTILCGATPAMANRFNLNCPDKPYSYANLTYANGAVQDRFELRDGDRAPGDVINHPNDRRQRCELVEQTRPAVGTQMWMSFSLRWSGDQPRTRNVLVQYHQPPDPSEGGLDGKRPGFILAVEDNLLVIATRADARATTTTVPPEVRRYARPMFTENAWHNVVLRVKYGPAGTGGYTLWIDGVRVSWQGSIPIGYNDPNGPRMAYGQYRQASSLTTVYDYANVEYAVDGTSLLHRVANPLPLPSGNPVSQRG